MGEENKFKNIVCDPQDVVFNIKRNIFELINLNLTTCNNLPNIQIPTQIPNVPNLNPSQKVIDLLNDILALVSGINFEEMRMQLINWLVEELEPLSKDLSINLIDSIKECYLCKINPKIPGWLFQVDPDTGNSGLGINIELNKIDLTCMFNVDPNSEVGGLIYDGNSSEDINTFLWDVIQEDGNPLIWSDPDTGKEIFEVRYYQNNPNAFVQSSGTTFQNIEPRDKVFNIRIVNNTYIDKSLVTVVVDYFNSQQPLFNVDKVIPNVIDLIYGTLTNKIELPDGCLTRLVEFEKALDDYIDKGIDNPEIVFDESFYTFDTKQLSDIKNTVKQKKSGVKEFKNCCGTKTSSISFETVNEITKNIESSSTLQEKISSYTNAFDKLVDESLEGVSNLEKNGASGEFFANFISSLQIALSKLVLSPKNLLMLNLLYYLINSKPIEEISVKEILKKYECIIRDIISELIRKLIYDFLLPLVIRKLTELATCVILKKLKERDINFKKSKLSLLPGFVNDKIEDINALFGKAEGAVEKARGFTDKVNLDSLNNINLQFGKKGRFCDT
jgi:hypothetical protein